MVCCSPRPTASCRPGLDRRGAQLVGDPRTLPVTAGANTPYHSAMLSASADLLATVATPIGAGVRLGTARAMGRPCESPERQPQGWPRLAPDGRRIALQMVDPVRGQSRHLGQGPPRRQPRPRHHSARFRSPPGVVSGWAAVGIRIRHVERAAVEHCGGRWHRRRSGTALSGRVLRADRLVTRRVSHRQHSPGHDWGWRCMERVARGRQGGSAILSEPFREHDARISADGQWLAYVSEETGGPVVSVRAMSGSPRRLVVSSDGGSQPVWRRDGQEILYVDLEGRLRGWSVHRQPGGELTLGVAKALSVPPIGSGHWGHLRRVTRRAIRLLHRPDACAEAERHRCRHRVAAPSSRDR